MLEQTLKRIVGKKVKIKIYLDTSIISALFDKRTPERMSLTKQFWDKISEYNVFISELVINEIKGTSEPLQSQMVEKVSNFTNLFITEKEYDLANAYIENKIFPIKYYDDALHVSTATTNEIGILLSWNFTHLVKLKTRRMVSLINTMHNYNPIEIITPPEL
jgi:predicted nucleic acid-binding protein